MKNIFVKVVLACSIFFSCSSETEEIIENDTGEIVNVALNRQATGASANDLLSADSFKKLIVEMAYIEGFEPTTTAINNLKVL